MAAAFQTSRKSSLESMTQKPKNHKYEQGEIILDGQASQQQGGGERFECDNHDGCKQSECIGLEEDCSCGCCPNEQSPQTAGHFTTSSMSQNISISIFLSSGFFYREKYSLSAIAMMKGGKTNL